MGAGQFLQEGSRSKAGAVPAAVDPITATEHAIADKEQTLNEARRPVVGDKPEDLPQSSQIRRLGGKPPFERGYR